MKILIIHNQYLFAGGEDRVVASEADLLKRHGHEVIFYPRSNKEIYVGRLRDKFRFVFNEMPWSRKSFRDLMCLIQEEKPDIAHVHNPFFMMTPSVYKACSDNGVPIVQTLHNYRFLCANGVLFRDGQVCERCLYGGSRQAVITRCIHHSFWGSFMSALILRTYRGSRILHDSITTFIAPSHFCKEIHCRHARLDEDKVYVKPHFIEDPGEAEPQRDYALYVGTIREYKGIQILLQAWGGLPDIPLKIAGEIPPENEWLMDRIPSVRNIELLGSLSMQETLDAMKKARCVIVPSICYETFARAIIEAYACGVPVIASDIGALSERVVDGQTGYLFRAGDPEDLRLKVKQLFEREEAYRQMGQQARRQYERHYTPEINCRILMDIYDKTLAETGGNPPRS